MSYRDVLSDLNMPTWYAFLCISHTSMQTEHVQNRIWDAKIPRYLTRKIGSNVFETSPQSVKKWWRIVLYWPSLPDLMSIVHAKVSFHPGAKPQLAPIVWCSKCCPRLPSVAIQSLDLSVVTWFFLLGAVLTAQVLNNHKKWETSKKKENSQEGRGGESWG